MDKIQELINRWYYYLDFKMDFYFGDDEITLEEYADLVEETFYVIKEMHSHIQKGDFVEENYQKMPGYIELVSIIARYGEPGSTDESEEYRFTTTRLIAVTLAELGANYSLLDPMGEGLMVSRTLDEDVIVSKMRRVENTIVSKMGYDNGIERDLCFDLKKKDFSDFQELARVLMED